MSVTNFPNPQNVAGTVDVGNLPAVQQVTGTVAVGAVVARWMTVTVEVLGVAA